MSLKVFHIVFVVASTIVAFGFGVWGVYAHVVYDNILFFGLGVCSFLGGVALIFYGMSIGKKLKKYGFL